MDNINMIYFDNNHYSRACTNKIILKVRYTTRYLDTFISWLINVNTQYFFILSDSFISSAPCNINDHYDTSSFKNHLRDLFNSFSPVMY